MNTERFFDDEIKPIYNRTKDVEPLKLRIKDMIYNASGYQQAVLKVYGYSKTRGHLGDHLKYITRDNDIELEDPTGNKLSSKEEIEDVLEHWLSDNDKRKNSRISVNMVLSAPKGSDPKNVKKAARDFAQENFGENHDYLFAIHDDTDNPHVHLVVKMRGYDGRKLRLGRKELHDMRQSFAECLRDRGVKCAATYRTDRGVGRKATSQKLLNMRRRGVVPDVDRAALRDAAELLKAEKSSEPWLPAIRRRNKTVREEYARVGAALMKSENSEVKDIGRLLSNYSKILPEPEPRNQSLMKTIKQRALERRNEKSQLTEYEQ